MGAAGQGFQLWQGGKEQSGVFLQNPGRGRAAKQLAQFLPHPLWRKAGQQLPALAGGRLGSWVDGKAQHGGKAQQAQNPQSVLLKPADRLAHAAQQAGLQIRPPSKRVPQAAIRVPGHGIDREIPAGQVLLNGGGVADGLWAAVAGVGPVRPEGGDLHQPLGKNQAYGAVGPACVHSGKLGKAGQHLLRAGLGSNVPVRGGPAQQAVPDAAAHTPGRMAPGLQAVQNVADVRGNGNGHRRLLIPAAGAALR